LNNTICLLYLQKYFSSVHYNVADIAQVAESLFCKQDVVGSSPTIGSDYFSWDELIDFY
jgi:hypothetical protein